MVDTINIIILLAVVKEGVKAIEISFNLGYENITFALVLTQRFIENL